MELVFVAKADSYPRARYRNNQIGFKTSEIKKNGIYVRLREVDARDMTAVFSDGLQWTIGDKMTSADV